MSKPETVPEEVQKLKKKLKGVLSSESVSTAEVLSLYRDIERLGSDQDRRQACAHILRNRDVAVEMGIWPETWPSSN